MFSAIDDGLGKGGSVTIAGVGTFATRTRAAHWASMPSPSPRRHVRKGQREMVAAAIRTAFVQDAAAAAAARQWRQVGPRQRRRPVHLLRKEPYGPPTAILIHFFMNLG